MIVRSPYSAYEVAQVRAHGKLPAGRVGIFLGSPHATLASHDRAFRKTKSIKDVDKVVERAKCLVTAHLAHLVPVGTACHVHTFLPNSNKRA